MPVAGADDDFRTARDVCRRVVARRSVTDARRVVRADVGARAVEREGHLAIGRQVPIIGGGNRRGEELLALDAPFGIAVVDTVAVTSDQEDSEEHGTEGGGVCTHDHLTTRMLPCSSVPSA